MQTIIFIIRILQALSGLSAVNVFQITLICAYDVHNDVHFVLHSNYNFKLIFHLIV